MKKESVEFLRKLVNSISPSGYEDEAAAAWYAEAQKFADSVRRDCHGNTDAVIHPGGRPRIMLTGHYDEIGFLVTHIDKEGFLWIAPVGGWDPQIPQGHRVVIRGRKGHVPGVIGKCPVHLLRDEARRRVTEITDIWVDIGARNGMEAENLVAVGDPLVLDHEMVELLGDRVAARAFDDRAGAFVVLETARALARRHPHAEVHAVATVQEEIGLRGARTAAFRVDPDVGLAVDVTFATDHPSMGEAMKREGRVELGRGPVISRGANINNKVFDLLVGTAQAQKMSYQVVAEPHATGTDANAIQLSRAGVATGLVSIPTRYLHSSCELISLSDVERCVDLLAAAIRRITPRMSFIPF